MRKETNANKCRELERLERTILFIRLFTRSVFWDARNTVKNEDILLQLGRNLL